MLAQEMIRKKRDRQPLHPDEIRHFINGVPDGQVSEGQVAAFCMAVLINGMTMAERVALTAAMAQSGKVLDWTRAGLSGPVLDKHSSGGVGDKVSLMLAPIVAACGGFVPMLSGRGLGHTGGTLDKMDAIAGYVSQPETALLQQVVASCGCAIVGATPDLAPADRIIYAIRDTTATVESIDLITASILSKKLAAGLDVLVMDIKYGNGAFMQDYGSAKALGQSIVSVANGAGLKTTGILTDMNQVLGRTAGNAVEVAEAVAFLRGDTPDPRLYAVTKALVTDMLVTSKLAADMPAAQNMFTTALDSGAAAAHFARMVAALGGPANFMDAPEKHMTQAKVIRDVFPDGTGGTVTGMDTRAIGIGIVTLGGGRKKPTDTIDHAVGLTHMVQIGEDCATGGRPIATLHAASEDAWQHMAGLLRRSVRFDGESTPQPVIGERITA